MNQLSQQIKNIVYSARRKMGMTPIYEVLGEIKKHNIDLKSLKVLDVFGGYGDQTSKDYYPLVNSVEVWEILPECEPSLRKNLPNATIRIVDSFKEMETTTEKFNFVYLDTPTFTYAGHCEHFDMFPIVYSILQDESFLLINVMPEINKERDEESVNQRKKFYGVDDPYQMSIEKMIEKYKSLSTENGFKLDWWFFKDRYWFYSPDKKHVRLCYLLLRLIKKVDDKFN